MKTFRLAGLVFCFLFSESTLFAAVKDSIAKKDAVAPPPAKFDYFRVGMDLSKLLSSPLTKNYKAYEFSVDAHYRKDIWMVADFGFGNSFVENSNLTFKSRNAFVRAGIDKTFFNQEFSGDLDNAFVGLRYGAAFVNRGAASYFIKDTVWGNTSGTIPSSNFVAHWLELGGGFRIEIIKNIFLGWNIRAKTFINPKKFEQLPPAYLAGYGRSEKNTAFGYNFFLMVGIGKKR